MDKHNKDNFGRPEPLMYGPGPKYRNIPFPHHHHQHDCHDHHDHHDGPPQFKPSHHDHHEHHGHHDCKPGIFPPPPFMVNRPCDRPGHPPIERPIPNEPCHGPHFRPKMNHKHHAEKYFYTILFLDNYYNQPDINRPIMPPVKPNGGQLKSWDICEDTETANIHWIDENRLYVRHNLQMPITLQMWDHQKNTIVYCPILKLNVDNVTMGNVQVDSPRSIIINFDTDKKPRFNQVYHLAIRSLPDFSLSPQEHQICEKPLSHLIEMPKMKNGLALIFRRNTLDGLYDLIAEFDDAYYHSLDDSSDLRYLTDKSCYKDVHFVTKYTNNLQDIIDLIDVGYYNIQYSWQDHKKYRQF